MEVNDKSKGGDKCHVFGWEVDVEFHHASGKPMQTFHWRGCSKGSARTKGLMKRLAARVVEIRPVTEEQWIRAYGIGRM